MAIVRMTEELKPGMRLNEDIYNRNKILLLSSGAVLTEENIKIIKRLGYSSVSVDRPQEDTSNFWPTISPEEILEIKDLYIKTNEESEDLIKAVISGNPVTIDEAYDIPGSLLSKPKAAYDLIPTLAHVLQLDKNTYNHSINVSLICGVICRWLGFPEDISKDYVVAGLFHDVGKTRLNPDILYKIQRSFKEQDDYESHTKIGYEILKNSGFHEDVCLGALLHHERIDGSGYPNGLKDEKIPQVAKLVAVADTFDKLTSEMAEKGQGCPFKVLEVLKNENLGLLDTKILFSFCDRTAECYVGEFVALSDGSKGQIVMSNRNNPCRPVVRIGDKLVELERHPELEIQSLVSIND